MSLGPPPVGPAYESSSVAVANRRRSNSSFSLLSLLSLLLLLLLLLGILLYEYGCRQPNYAINVMPARSLLPGVVDVQFVTPVAVKRK